MQDPLLNHQLGPYLLERVVGRGGMGTVYAAKDNQTGKIAAVKVLSPVLGSDPSFRERFSDEVESLKKLRHPQIVQLLGEGEQEGQLFYAMELIDGNSLQEELRRGRRFTWREVTQIAIEICGALKHAHDHGIIHRDLKPANLLYTRDEKIKLLDFGIAKLFGNTGVTTGSVMGTADYMAPEQAEGKAVGPRTDLYSLGSVMYALLAGRPPFVGKSVPEVVHKVRFESPVPIGRLANEVPVEMELLIDQLLEKQPQKRVPTALAVAHRLRAMEHALSIRPPSSPTPDDIDTSVSVPPAAFTGRTPISGNATIRLEAHRDSDPRVEKLTVTTREAEIETGPDRFVMVDDERAAHQRPTMPWQTLALLASLISLVLAAYATVNVLTRPPTADELFDEVMQTYDPANPSSLLKVDNQVNRFLELYPADSRAAEINELASEITLYRLERRLELKAQRRTVASDAPLEQLYVELTRQLRTRPDEARAALHALLAVYQNAPELTAEDRQYLDLARKQLTRLDRQQEREAATQLPLLERRLAQAGELAAEDPAAARRICLGIVELYDSKAWAAPLVQAAQELLERLPAAADRPTGSPG